MRAVLELAVMAEDDVDDGLGQRRREPVDLLDLPADAVICRIARRAPLTPR